MSLLLDALKKAAEEKKKNAASSDTENSAAADDSIVPEDTDFGFDLKDDDTLISEFNTPQKSGIVDDEAEDIIIVDTEGDTQLPSFDEDESILLSNEDVSDFLGSPDLPTSNADESAGLSSPDPGEDDDLSLSLVDAEDGFDEILDTATNGPQTMGTNLEMLGSGAKTDHIELDDDYDLIDEASGAVTRPPESTVTTGIELDNLRNENTIIRRDTTSTNTYAPDNYDRTLIKAASEDASKVFAGMKSEEDVLITPDYAKRVFLSKSSAHRAQHYKIYLGIAVCILLATGVFAMLELQSEYDRVDSALLPLKRDPMPGVIKTAGINDSASLFDESPEPQVDNKTLELIENAELTVYDSAETNTDGAEIEIDIATEAAESNAVSNEVVVEELPVNDTKVVVVTTVSDTKQAKQNISVQDNPVSAGAIKISTGSKITDRDRWLTDAYAAYQRGDDEAALRKYNQVLEVNPLNRNALLARAAIAIQNGDVASAIADYQLLLTQNPKDSLAMSSLISVTSLSPQRSETKLKLMIHEEPDSPYLNFVLANIYGAQNRWQEAQRLYFKALENKPEDPNYAYNLAISLEHISKPKVAITYYEKALLNIKKGLATFDEDVVSLRIEMLRKL